MRLILIFLLFSSFVFSHGGGTDSEGCHNDYANDDFHCHHGCPPHYHNNLCEYDYEDCGTYDDDDYYYSSRDSSGSSGIGWDIIFSITFAGMILFAGAFIFGIINGFIIDPIREPIRKRKELERKRIEKIENEKQRKFLQEKEKEEKINNLIRDAEDNPKDSKKSSSVTWEYSRRNEYELALLWFDKTLYLNPNDIYTLNKRAQTKNILKDVYGAIEDYSRALEINPKNTTSLNNRGCCYENLKDFDKAFDDFNALVKIDKTNILYLHNRAITNAKLKKTKVL